ncbi:IS66 family insertion sequence element accessory protein TnpB [Lichenifustis flavocetrariae]|uniref:IS66 family insertion sequence element accessory protein TnpB n=1 Tax=Lichenifustis flavocetrariae TaxID=2949735 RepID=A0AA42CN23_9HYPH|nr:IS66 family insertion sequence element accessory protein TnpB [Lichenifustis flavocetrariae]MCW6513098.1 IS66 family insertion sequence element accessory protein TnpB [Lichenifustis flavocetrariae]
MSPVASNVRIWIASGHTDMRKGMQGLALLVQEGLKRDPPLATLTCYAGQGPWLASPFAGDVFVFRGRGGSLIKALWRSWLEAPACAAG